MISFEAARPAPFVDWALELAGRFLGVGFGPAPPEGPVDVYYGDDPGRPCALRIPRVARYDEGDVPGLPEPAAPVDAGAAFPFDLFAALRFWLADEGNAGAPADAFDLHDRLGAAHSAQERRGLRELPIANAYLALFGRWLEARAGARPRPPVAPGRCVVLLSHDVDEPDDPSPWQRARSVGLAARRGELRLAVAFARSLRGELAQRGGRHWLFREVLEAEARHGFHSTFFFASRNQRDPQASLLDVTYDVAEPRFAEVFRAIAERGSEVGLHISYRARESADRIAEEKRRLEAASGAEVAGSRHHYWHMAKPFWRTLADHARAGLRYDASIAFNDAPGLRLGIAFPFHPFDPERGAAIPALQLPTFAMDGALFREPGTPVERALVRCDELLAGLKRFGGVASLDWHVRTSWPGSPRFRVWGETYLALLERLAADPQVEIASCGEAWRRFGGDSTNNPDT